MRGIIINFKNKKAVLLSLAVLVVLFSIGTVVYGNMLLSNPNIYENIYVNDVNIGGMSAEDAKKVLENKYSGFADEKQSIYLVYEDLRHEVEISTLNVIPNINATVDKAFEVARSGNVIKRLGSIIKTSFSKYVLPLEVELDNNRLNDEILAFSSQIDNKEEMFIIDKENELLKIHIEKTDKLIDVAKTNEEFVNRIKSGSFEDVEPVFVSTNDPQKKADLLYNRIAREPTNATVKLQNGKLVYIEEQFGIDFDKNELLNLLINEKGMISLKIKIIKPEITVEELKAKAFSDILGTYTTYYDNSIVGRTQNIVLAAKKMNQYIIPSGGVFSFNKVVGRRTIEAGFAMGKIFAGDNVVDDVGGGICQVSTTLYNAVLKANLNVIERHNHKFAITYAPKGQDATVSYGSLDFRFGNNTKYPIKIVTSTGGGKLSVSIMGYKSNPGQTVEILNIVKSTSTFATREKINPNPNVTNRVIQQSGMNGAVVDTYKIIKQNGVEASRTFLHTSVYIPMDKIVIVPQNEAQQEQPQQTQDTQPTQSPKQSPPPTATENPPGYDTPIETIPPAPGETTPPTEEAAIVEQTDR